MGPIGVFIYMWYLDTFDMVYKKEDVPPLYLPFINYINPIAFMKYLFSYLFILIF